MSKILAALAKAAGLDVPKTTDVEGIKKVVATCSRLKDPEWNKLSEEQQDYVNDAVDAINAKKDIPLPPDAEAEEPAPRRRRAAEDDAPAAAAFKKGDKVVVTNKRGRTFEATVVDPDDRGEFVVDDGKDELAYAVEDVKSGAVKVEAAKKPEPEPEKETRRTRQRDAEPEAPADPQKGDTVEVIDARDKVHVGRITEVTDDAIVIVKIDGDERDFDRARVKSVKVKVRAAEATKEPAPAPAGRSRTRAAAEDKGDDGKNTRASNPGVSVGQRIREIMLDNDGIKEEDVGKQLDKEGLKYAPASLSMNYRDTIKFLDLLRSRKMLKA